MSAERERRIRDLFLEVCDLGEGERRETLEQRTAGDPELLSAVEELLAEDEATTSFLAQPALGDDFHVSGPYAVSGSLAGEETGGEQHPEAIGPYRIVGVIGSGGMGIVYRAEQQSPRRIVALKVVRGGMPGSFRKYFELEAKALGRLKHPCIAQIHEAGTADFGRGPVPFLVMEYVAGVDLVRFARESGLDLRERIALMEKVCRAVHHAHQKGVIHRDLKPGNVLVTESGEPKVLDFGLARLVDEERTRTGTGDTQKILGTLAYMSPGQVAADPDAGDASTDVYSLGATAYELVAGRPPYELRGLSLPAALLRVSQDEPDDLQRVVPGVDLDVTAVVQRAMARDRDARYPSADAFAEDLQRWLRHEPVSARTAGAFEQFRKFARRNSVLVGGAGAFVLALIGGIIGTTWQARIADFQAERAKNQAERAQNMEVFLRDRLRSAGDPRSDGKELPILHVLEGAARDLDEAFANDPEKRAELADTLGMAFYENGRYQEAEALVRSALDWRMSELGPRSPEALASQRNLGIALIALGRLVEAEEELRPALAGMREIHGIESEDTQRTMNWLGRVLLQHADPKEAGQLFRESWSVRRRTLGEEALLTLSSRQNLAIVWRRLGRLGEAESALRDILDAQRRICGPEDFDVYETLNNLASVLVELGEFQAATPFAEEAYEGYLRLRGPDHPDTSLVRHNVNISRSQLADASVSGSENEAVSKEEHPLHHAFRISTAVNDMYRGRIDEAERDINTAIDALEAVGGMERYLYPARQCRVAILLERGRFEAAIELQREMLEAHEDAGTGDSNFAYVLRASLAESLRRAGRLDEALEHARSAYAGLETIEDGAPVYRLMARTNLSAVLADLGQVNEALVHNRAVMQVAEEAFGDPNMYKEAFRIRLGRNLTLQREYAEAERELLTARSRLAEIHTERGIYTRKAGEALAALYDAWGREEDAMHWRAEVDASHVAPVEAAASGSASDE